MALNSLERKCLEKALDAAKLTCCGCSEESKKEMKGYLDTWVVSHIQVVLDASGGDKRAKGHLHLMSRYE